MGEMRVMGPLGDVRQVWDPSNADEVAAAKRVFDDLTRKGHRAYSVRGDKGKKGEVITEFDPAAGKIILAPAMAGG